MSKWTLIRKTQAVPKCGLHNLREGCFKMKVDHCKNQGAAMFDFKKHIVKLQVEIRANNPSHDRRKRRSADLALARDWSQKMTIRKIYGPGWVGLRRYFIIRIKNWGRGWGGPWGPQAPLGLWGALALAWPWPCGLY